MVTINIAGMNMSELIGLRTEMVGQSEQAQEETWGVSIKEVEAAIDAKGAAGAVGITVSDTEQGIQADLDIIKNFEDKYQSLVNSESKLEKECTEYASVDLSEITTSAKAEEELKKLDEQIARLEKLVDIAKKTIETLEKEQATVSAQMEQRQAQYDKLTEEMLALDEQIKSNQKKAEEISNAFVEKNKSKIEAAAEEYKQGNYEQEGVTLEAYLAEKVGTISAPGEISTLSASSQNLYDQLEMKGSQLKLVGSMMDKLQEVLDSIDARLTEQNNKLTEFDSNLNASKEFREGLVKLRDQLKKQEAAKKKKWYKKALNGIKKAVKSTVKLIKRGIKNLCGSVGAVFKYVGNQVGHVIDKYVGLDNIGHGIQAAGRFADGASKMVGALSTFDKKAIKDSYKYMEKNTMETLTTAVVIAGGAAAGVGGSVVLYGAAKAGAFSAIGDVANSVVGEVGRFVDRRLGLDALGKGIKSIGKFVEGSSNMIEGTVTDNDDQYKEGKKAVNENALKAAVTAGQIALTVVTAGAASGAVAAAETATGVAAGAAGAAAASGTAATITTVASETAGFLASSAVSEIASREIDNKVVSTVVNVVGGSIASGFTSDLVTGFSDGFSAAISSSSNGIVEGMVDDVIIETAVGEELIETSSVEWWQ